MSTLTTNDIKNVGQLQEKNEFASNDALLAWDAAGQKHVKLTYQKLNQAYSTIQSACETAQGAAEYAAAEAAGFAKGTGGGTYTNNNAEYFKTQAAAEALKSEGWAEGTENGTDVPSTSPYHEHNSKYWATQAGTSAGSAGTDALKAEGFAVGQQNGTDVPSTSPYYENNAAYYADQASDSADAAAGSASDAEDWAEIARDAAAGALGNFFGACSTLAGTAAKDVAISEFSLYTGVKVQVKFTNGHTLTATKDANGVVTADYPTLNVSSTGAKAIKVGAEYAGENFVTAGDTHEFIYDGTYWVDLTAVNIYENSTTARKRDGKSDKRIGYGSLFSTASLDYSYTVQERGLYLVYCQANPAEVTQNLESIFYINGAAAKRASNDNSGTGYSPLTNMMFFGLVPGDIVRITMTGATADGVYNIYGVFRIGK